MLAKAVLISVTVIICLSIAGTSPAAPEGSDRKGKYTYRKIYKACHERGEVESAKPSLSPDTKTMAQWQRLFEKKEYGLFGCKEEWQQLDEKDVEDIFTYLYKHAADSPTPAKCK